MEPANKQKKKSTGRKKKAVEEVRGIRLSFRVTENEHQGLQQIVDMLRLNVGGATDRKYDEQKGWSSIT